MTIKGAIFDMDGLMFDTERLMMKAWMQAGAQMGFPVDEETVMRAMGSNAQDTRRIFSHIIPDDLDYQECRVLRNRLLARDIEINGLPVKPGLYELLEILQKTGRKIALATSTSRERAEGYLQKAGVQNYFDAVIYGNTIEKGKPEPDIYLAAAAAIGLEPGNCIALEDSPTGILSAYRAGCKAVMVPDLVTPSAETSTLLYACVFSLAEVIPLLEEGA